MDEFDAAIADLLAGWQNQRCHRSAFSWQALVAKDLARDPHSSVTFVHLACSGATVQHGLIGEYTGIKPVGKEFLPPQVERARELVCGEGPCDADDREVDHFFVSIGGNDVNFSPIVEKCVATEPCFDNPILDAAAMLAMEIRCRTQPPFGQACVDTYTRMPNVGETANDLLLDGADESERCGSDDKLDGCNGLDDLPSHYAKLKQDLNDAFGEEVASRVVLAGLPQVTFDENRQRCGWHPLDDRETRSSNFPGLSTSEMEWVGDVMLGSLDRVLGEAAALHNWTYVDGHIEDFLAHGYCSTSGWMVRLTETHLSQGDIFGALHPNRAGHEAYARAVVSAVPEPNGLISAAMALCTLAGIARFRAR
jgi:lysophospholipase L1-like esterase